MKQYRRQMPRWSLFILFLAAVIGGGIGTALLNPFATGYGWTAYAPLRLSSDSSVYMPIDPTWLEWRPRVGAALLMLGAGTTGATLVALITKRRRMAAA